MIKGGRKRMKNIKLERIERIKIKNDLEEHKELINRIIK